MTDHRECEAVRLLNLIINGHADERRRALSEARVLLRAARGGGRRNGRKCAITNPSLLRSVAYLRARGRTEHEIARITHLKRATVHHHLKPSGAMQDALLEKETA